MVSSACLDISKADLQFSVSENSLLIMIALNTLKKSNLVPLIKGKALKLGPENGSSELVRRELHGLGLSIGNQSQSEDLSMNS